MVGDIYWGAIPCVFLQVILVIIVIFWPGSVTYWIERGTGVDPSKVEINVPTMIPSLGLIFLVLGTIFMGLATKSYGFERLGRG